MAGTITGIGGGGQAAPVGSCLPNPLVVQILSTLGSPLSGINVIFSVVSGDATIVENQPVLTDTNGNAAAEPSRRAQHERWASPVLGDPKTGLQLDR
jgi:hypothetical protein